MPNPLQKLTCYITSKDLWIDHFLAKDEPDCQITTFEVEVIGASSIERVQFGFCHRGWMEAISDVPGYDLYKRFASAQVGDLLVIEYLVIGSEPEVLSYMGGHTAGRGTVLGLDNRTRSGWLSIENQTQGWEIDLRKTK